MKSSPSRRVLKERVLKDDRICLFRDADKEDAKRIVAYINSIAGESDYLSFGRDELTLSEEAERQIIASFNEQANSLMAVAECEDKLNGLITMQGGSKQRINHWAEIALSVSKPYWGMGIGKTLIELAFEHAQSSGITRIGLKVRSDNDRARCLYSKLGFEIEGTLKRYMRIGDEYFDFYQMGRDVKSLSSEENK